MFSVEVYGVPESQFDGVSSPYGWYPYLATSQSAGGGADDAPWLNDYAIEGGYLEDGTLRFPASGSALRPSMIGYKGYELYLFSITGGGNMELENLLVFSEDDFPTYVDSGVTIQFNGNGNFFLISKSEAEEINSHGATVDFGEPSTGWLTYFVKQIGGRKEGVRRNSNTATHAYDFSSLSSMGLEEGLNDMDLESSGGYDFVKITVNAYLG